MQLNVKNETSTLKAVVLGQPGSIGKVPTLEETYDAKSYESVLHNIYPHEEESANDRPKQSRHDRRSDPQPFEIKSLHLFIN